jgi:hypothetical protein
MIRVMILLYARSWAIDLVASEPGFVLFVYIIDFDSDLTVMSDDSDCFL